ncbi:MCE family protein [Nocardia huaxiensis]|uniref:MCE family protein n=1 Tax=Nocardia huaxiensis TaxID=2755382 RepID=A0A7D6ZN34_9NOCA|nr:MlaD family protein [Nocardia huaxiensis]QLY29565.1 MCE family protein [Nocardia huaxiensis]
METTRNRARAAGAALAALLVLAVPAWNVYTDRSTGDRIRIQLRTEQTGEGIVAGASVRYDGVAVGEITEVAPIDQGRQLLTLELDRAQTAGLTDALSVDYAPENLFGVSAVALRKAEGGAALRDGQLIDLAGKVTDVTMGALLRQLTSTATDVLTPKLTELLTQVNGDLRAFTPMLQAVIMLNTVVADTQQYPVSYLLGRYSEFFDGFGEFTSSTFKLAKAIMDIEVFVNDRDRYNASIDMLRNGALGGIANVLNVAGTHFAASTDQLAPTVQALADTIADPAAARAQVTEMIERLHRVFADTPNGPTVNLAVTLKGVPAVGIPMLGQQAFAALTAPATEGGR